MCIQALTRRPYSPILTSDQKLADSTNSTMQEVNRIETVFLLLVLSKCRGFISISCATKWTHLTFDTSEVKIGI